MPTRLYGIRDGCLRCQPRAELHPTAQPPQPTGISKTYTYAGYNRRRKCGEVYLDAPRHGASPGGRHSHSLSRAAFREIHIENCPPTASSRPVCRVTMRETLSENAMLYPRETPRCGFDPCASVLAAELAGGPGCGLVGGCVSTRFGPAPRPKPPAPVRRRQRPQVRLFGEAVGKGKRKRRRVGGAP